MLHHKMVRRRAGVVRPSGLHRGDRGRIRNPLGTHVQPNLAALSCGHARILVSLSGGQDVPRHERGQSWELFDAYGFRVDHLRMVSNCTSACCTSRLARGNSKGRTHSETSSNYLCTNDW